MTSHRWLLTLTAVGLLAGAGCAIHDLGPARTTEKSVDAGSAESVRAEIRMGAGELRLGGGAKKVLEAKFRTNLEAPEVRYDVSAGRGRLVVDQPGNARGSNIENDWDLKLGNGQPLELTVNLGAGQSEMDFTEVNLRSLDVNMGVGELKLDLRGNYKRDLDVRVRGGVGQATIRLPGKIGVRVDARGGIGGISTHNLKQRGRDYYNEAYEDAKVRMRVEVRGGVGQISLIGEE